VAYFVFYKLSLSLCLRGVLYSARVGTISVKMPLRYFLFSNTVNLFFCDETQLSKTFRMVFLCSNTIMKHKKVIDLWN
jgi:hypothetical protein